MHATHEAFVARTEPEFEKCREAIKAAWERFERLVVAGRRNLWDSLFNDLKEDADDIVEKNFGENDVISSQINRAFKRGQNELKDKLQEQFEAYLNDLGQDMHQAIQRLMEDVARVEFEQLLYDAESLNINYKTPDLDLGFELGDYGWMAFNIGSYALAGAGIGTAFPVIGNLIGAVAGALVGIFVSVLSIFTSKEKRIRKAQGQVQEKIDDACTEARNALKEERKTLFTPVRKHINETVLPRVQQLEESLKRPLDVIEQQIALMTLIKEQLENIPYGTIQSVQR